MIHNLEEERKKRLEKLKNFKPVENNYDGYKNHLLEQMNDKKEIKLNRGIYKCIEYFSDRIKVKKTRKNKK